jgi:cellulose synthase/poly-beta-1,6-N-acetylglucosamine synthase-like glycosyltransferase
MQFRLGLVVWYQKIEYAIQHWFAKVSESVFGCVLCAPGCFSLFRGMALIDDNVLKVVFLRLTDLLSLMYILDIQQNSNICYGHGKM